MKKAFLMVTALLLIALAAVFAGCASAEDPASRLDKCRQAVSDYTEQGGYLHFKQEAEYVLGTAEGEFEQKLLTEGDSIFPNRQSYDYEETMSSSKVPGEAQRNTFSYLTLDRGKTAFVRGERLSAQLGVTGWVHYTPLPDQSRYFDLPELIERLTAFEGNVQGAGHEDVDGADCVHVLYTMSGQELLDLRMQEDPSLAEKYQGVDLSGFLGDLQVDMWIAEVDGLPRRILMDQALSVEGGVKSSSHYRISLTGWGEESPKVIEQPAFYSEAK